MAKADSFMPIVKTMIEMLYSDGDGELYLLLSTRSESNFLFGLIIKNFASLLMTVDWVNDTWIVTITIQL